MCAITRATPLSLPGPATVKLTIGRTPGFFWVSVQHDPLPPSSQSSDIFDGKWTLTTLRGSFSGKVIGGEIVNAGGNIFKVTARLRLEKGGAGDVMVIGDLDHNDLPPTFEGDLVQQP